VIFMQVDQTVQPILEGTKANLAIKAYTSLHKKTEDYKQGVNKRINPKEVITNRDAQFIRKYRGHRKMLGAITVT